MTNFILAIISSFLTFLISLISVGVAMNKVEDPRHKFIIGFIWFCLSFSIASGIKEGIGKYKELEQKLCILEQYEYCTKEELLKTIK